MRMDRFSPIASVPETLTLGGKDTIKILLTTKEDDAAKRPHQIFLLVKDAESDLETFYSFDAKDSGKAKAELVRLQQDLYMRTCPFDPIEANPTIMT